MNSSLGDTNSLLSLDGKSFHLHRTRVFMMQLGHEGNGEADEPLPRQVQALVGFFVTRVACGEGHTVCLLDSGNFSSMLRPAS